MDPQLHTKRFFERHATVIGFKLVGLTLSERTALALASFAPMIAAATPLVLG